MIVAVLGASGKTGRYVAARLARDGHRVIAIGRSAGRLARIAAAVEPRIADLEDAGSVRAALADAEIVVSLAHARFAAAVLDALPVSCRRVVLTGSTRKFTQLPDPAADAVRAGEAAFLASGRPGVMLHPSMIYGAPDDRNVNRLLRLFRRWPRFLPIVVPLPDGGRHLVQPVFVDDVVEAFAAAVARPDVVGTSIVVAGPEPIPYAAFVRACAAAVGRRAYILPVPSALLIGVASLLAALGLRPPFNAAELRRAAETKRFDVAALRDRLGVVPRPFAEGLRLKLERGWIA
ncbi:MAG TPA: NAD(P)H-binding protein [Alphaproteobacteria bacterium]|nr:NAD(P)H-binding protein [Alphaproteobacteria bacterium]